MGRKRPPGLFKRGNYWHIDKQISGFRLQEGTGSQSLSEAERYLARRIEEIRQATVYGVRPKRVFEVAATKYLLEHQHKASIVDDAILLEQLNRYVGHLHLEQIHNGTLQPYIKARKAIGRKTKTINLALAVVRRILNLAATEWIDENGLTWLVHPPKIKLLPITDAREPYPLSWDEQTRLLNALPEHLSQMALFKINTGCRDQEICHLRWEWEMRVPELNTSVFIIPKYQVKNREDRLVVLNRVAQQVIETVRGIHPTFVFTYQGHPITGMNNTAWKRARKKIGLSQVRVHDLKHTFGRRLRAAGVSFEDRQDLLGHKSGRITTHYSAAELEKLIEAANKACDPKRRGMAITLLKPSQWVSKNNPYNIPTMEKSTELVLVR